MRGRDWESLGAQEVGTGRGRGSAHRGSLGACLRPQLSTLRGTMTEARSKQAAALSSESFVRTQKQAPTPRVLDRRNPA